MKKLLLIVIALALLLQNSRMVQACSSFSEKYLCTDQEKSTEKKGETKDEKNEDQYFILYHASPFFAVTVSAVFINRSSAIPFPPYLKRPSPPPDVC